MRVVERLTGTLGRDIVAASPVASGDGREHHRLVLRDRPVPLTLDVLAATGATPRRVVHLLPGGGLNARAGYFTAPGRSLAQFLCDHGFLVVGISPREDALTTADADCADWGLAHHRADVERVVAAVREAVDLPYDLLGHSAGALLALDTAAHGGGRGPQRVIALDTTGPFDPVAEPGLTARAADLTAALQQLLDQGIRTVDPGLKTLFARAAEDPDGDSGVPRPVDASTRFGNLALAHYALTHTRELPGPANWIYQRGHSSGEFHFGATPRQDRFALDRTPFAVWAAAVGRLGSGLQPTALLRDLAAVWAGRDDVYRIDWAAIRAEVVWINTELGRGDHDLAARLIREGGGGPVGFSVLPGYGHGDVVWAATAEHEVWPSLLPAGD
ncbi:alpha/beta hydrolase [Kitasatospora sp. HPMI-4]|uniref:alpha/beta hydrolase n=1 Tax=Kitasatospora sp. HPMI-4 TaxID=3448443 RepID=UPI003F194BDA